MKKHTFIDENGDKITVNGDNANRYYMGYRVHFNKLRKRYYFKMYRLTN